MKKVFFLFLFLSSSEIYAGNWDLFPLDHRNVYISTQHDSVHIVYTYKVDSLRIVGTDSFYLFNRKNYSSGFPFCYSHINYQ